LNQRVTGEITTSRKGGDGDQERKGEGMVDTKKRGQPRKKMKEKYHPFGPGGA